MWWLEMVPILDLLGHVVPNLDALLAPREEPSRRRGFQHQRAAWRQPVIETRDHTKLFGVVVQDTRAPDQIERNRIGQNIVIHDVAVADVDLVENATAGQVRFQNLLGRGAIRPGPCDRAQVSGVVRCRHRHGGRFPGSRTVSCRPDRSGDARTYRAGSPAGRWSIYGSRGVEDQGHGREAWAIPLQGEFRLLGDTVPRRQRPVST